jgi:hypothetical protein
MSGENIWDKFMNHQDKKHRKDRVQIARDEGSTNMDEFSK